MGLTRIGAHDGVELFVTEGGTFKAFNPVSQKAEFSATLTGLKASLDKGKRLAPVTLLGMREMDDTTRDQVYIQEVTVTGVGRPSSHRVGPRNWGGCGEMHLFAFDSALKADADALVVRHESEREELARRQEAEGKALQSRLVPLVDDEVKTLLYGGKLSTPEASTE